jgi:hypothetical protein
LTDFVVVVGCILDGGFDGFFDDVVDLLDDEGFLLTFIGSRWRI